MEKKIIFFDSTLQQGGAERVISILSKRMVELGYKVDILLYYNRDIFYDIHPDVNICTVEGNTKTTNILKNIIWIRKYFQEHQGVIISFLAPFNMIALAAHMGVKSPIIVADRNDPRYVPTNVVLRKIRDLLYRLADGVVLQTTKNKEYFPLSIQKKSAIIFNPVDLREKKGIALYTTKNKEIVSVGRLVPQKNQGMLIEAFSEVYKKHPDYSLIIYGDDSNVEQKELLKLLIKRLGLEKVIYLPGNTKEVVDKIAKSEIFVLSSNYEGMPNALIEAMCAGLPCVSTRVSGATDLIVSGANGELVDIGDVDALSSCINKLIENEGIRKTYSKNAIAINKKLDTDTITRQWIEFIDRF